MRVTRPSFHPMSLPAASAWVRAPYDTEKGIDRIDHFQGR